MKKFIILWIGIFMIFIYISPIVAIAINRNMSINNSYLLLKEQFPEIIDTFKIYLYIGGVHIGYAIAKILTEIKK